MRLIDLIEKIQQGRIEQYLIENKIDIEYDLIDIYAKNKIELNSVVEFFNAEEILNEIILNVDGILYENVCPLNMLEDIVQDHILQNPQIDSFELANQVIPYLEKDA